MTYTDDPLELALMRERTKQTQFKSQGKGRGLYDSRESYNAYFRAYRREQKRKCHTPLSTGDSGPKKSEPSAIP